MCDTQTHPAAFIYTASQNAKTQTSEASERTNEGERVSEQARNRTGSEKE